MTKKIEDYLHLYIGCKCIVPEDKYGFKKGFLSGMNYEGTSRNFPEYFVYDYQRARHKIDTAEIKLILRPLQDMTEEDELEINAEFGSTYLCENLKDGTYHAMNVHESFSLNRTLERMGFDIHGLHDAGLCVYEKELK